MNHKVLYNKSVHQRMDGCCRRWQESDGQHFSWSLVMQCNAVHLIARMINCRAELLLVPRWQNIKTKNKKKTKSPWNSFKSLIYCLLCALLLFIVLAHVLQQPVTTQKSTWYKPGMKDGFTFYTNHSQPENLCLVCTINKYIPGMNDGITLYTKKSPPKKIYELRIYELRSLRDKSKKNRHLPVLRGSKPLQTTHVLYSAPWSYGA